MRISGSACEEVRRAFCILDVDFLIYENGVTVQYLHKWLLNSYKTALFRMHSS